CESASLTARETGHFAQRIVAPESETRKVLPRRVHVEIAAHAPDLLDAGLRGVDRAEVLIEVALAQVRPASDPALVGPVGAVREELEQRRLARAVRSDDADAVTAPNEEIEITEQMPAATLGAEPVRVEHDVAAARRRRESERDALGHGPNVLGTLERLQF